MTRFGRPLGSGSRLPGTGMSSLAAWGRSALRLAEVRLRIPIVLVAAALVVGRWDTIANYWDRLIRRAPVESFTGTVWQEPIIEAPAPARVRSGLVRFEPGARTAWHTHPLGQTLFVVSGAGRVQSWGGKMREIKSGDVVWIPPNEKHWHGAAPSTSMVHVATQEALDGKHVTWMEHVSDEQYQVAVGS